MEVKGLDELLEFNHDRHESDVRIFHDVTQVIFFHDLTQVIFFHNVILYHYHANFFINDVHFSYKHKNLHQIFSRIEGDLNSYHIDEVYNNALNNISSSLHPNCVVDFIFILLIFILFLFILFLRYSLDQTIFQPFSLRV